MKSLTTNNPFFKNLLQSFFNNNNNITKLHRWCTIVSPVYNKTCNWEKKMEFAQKDNCFNTHSKPLKEDILIDPITNKITFFKH